MIYFYHNVSLPLFALTVYAKNEHVDISSTERKNFRRLTRLLIENYARHKK